ISSGAPNSTLAGGGATGASGDVSGMPPACTMRPPERCSHAPINDPGTAEPPQKIMRNDDRAISFVSPYRRMSLQIVGTAPLNVTRSSATMRVSGSACMHDDGITSDAPHKNEAYGIPHAFAWNIGTIISTRSRSERPSAFGVVDA